MTQNSNSIDDLPRKLNDIIMHHSLEVVRIGVQRSNFEISNDQAATLTMKLNDKTKQAIDLYTTSKVVEELELTRKDMGHIAAARRILDWRIKQLKGVK